MIRHSENMPILYRNILDGLNGGTERDAFLWAVDRPGEDRYCYRAEKFAREVGKLLNRLAPLVVAAADKHAENGIVMGDDKLSDLMKFMLIRHANWRLGGNVTDLPFLGSAQ